jgi:spermidine synthase
MMYIQVSRAVWPPMFELRMLTAVSALASRRSEIFPPPAVMPWLQRYLSSMLAAENLDPIPRHIARLMSNLTNLVTQLQAGPVLYKKRHTLALLFDVFAVQSEMSLADPDELVLGYTQLMMGFLLFNAAPRSIGMIGLGGGSLAKFCYRHLSDALIEVAEICPQVIAVRGEFMIPPDGPRFKVHCQDGADFVARNKSRFDVLLNDGFDKAGQPPQLSSRRFYDDCYASLAPQGMMVTNVLGGEKNTDAQVDAMRDAFKGEVYVIDAYDSLNQIAFACKGDLLKVDLRTMMERTRLIPCLHSATLRLIAHGIAYARNGVVTECSM